MGRRDAFGKRMKWSRSEKRMMREWREVCARLQQEAERERQIHFPDGPGESSAAGASSSSFNDPRFPPHLQHLSPLHPQNQVPRPSEVAVSHVSNPERRDEDVMSQHSAGTELLSEDSPSQRKQEVALTMTDGEGPQSGNNPAETPAESVDLLDIPNDVMEGVFDWLTDDEAVRLLSISKTAPSVWEGRKRVEGIQKKRKLQAKVVKAWKYWFRYIRPRDFPRTLSQENRDFRIREAARDVHRFNTRLLTGKDSINTIAHRWGVYGTEVREFLMWSETDSSDDDVMQQ